MASHEHIQQLDDEESSTSSSSSSSLSDFSGGPQDVKDDSTEPQGDVAEPQGAPMKPPLRLKLSLRLPRTSKAMEEKPESVTQDPPASKGEDVDATEQVVGATVVSSDVDETDEVIEATVVEEAPGSRAVKSSISTQAKSKPAKIRRSPTPLIQGGRPVRLPPMSSPGLLIPPSAGVFRGDADPNGFTTAASVFSRAMSLAGYTTEGRTENPHRGSSVKRVVDDMFDSNIMFTLHFPDLVPNDLWNQVPPNHAVNVSSSSDHNVNTQGSRDSLLQILTLALGKACTEGEGEHQASAEEKASYPDAACKHQICVKTFGDMAPITISTPYPESYSQRRKQYVQDVLAREHAIVASQEAAQSAEEAMESYEEALVTYNSGSKRPHNGVDTNGVNGPPEPPQSPVQIEVPPIPAPPSPPREADLSSLSTEAVIISTHPSYPMAGKERFISHLDKDCFHITDGRYYGLSTNNIADPHFVGPNAPGIGGLNISGATGLATSYLGSSASGGGAGASQAYHGGSVGGGSSGSAFGATTKSLDSTKGVSKKGATHSSGPSASSSPKTKKKRRNGVGPSPTSNSVDLKRFMEQESPEMVEQMRICIIRAAVYASRTGMHGGSFVGVNRETYPDASKAFAAHGNLRPCSRCKSNKQGAYHCRLRRKHKDVDYDGGNSWETLAPLFEEEVDALVQM